MKDLSKVRIPRKYKSLFLLVYNGDGSIMGGSEIVRKDWKKTYTKFAMTLAMDNKPYRLNLHASEVVNGTVNIKELIMEEDINVTEND